MILKNGIVFIDGKFKKSDILIEDGIIKDIKDEIDEIDLEDDLSIDLNLNYVFPGLIDVHTHLREPGFEYKETIETGSMAGAKGGYTSICAMPNLNPVPDSKETLQIELDKIKETAKINYKTLLVK